MVFHLLGENPFLDLVTVFEQFLDNVVAENVSHQLQGIGSNLPE